jgi:hypothetical protein
LGRSGLIQSKLILVPRQVLLVETDSERIPAVAAGLASEYDKEQFLTLRYPAVLRQGSSFCFLDGASGRSSGFPHMSMAVLHSGYLSR